MTKMIDMTGRVYGRLTIIERDASVSDSASWKCVCSCGTVVTVWGSSLRKGFTQSCGCLHKERTAEATTTHGHTSGGIWTPTYRSWASMIMRCFDPRQKSYADYGGRGITVCERWRSSFENFLADMGERPKGKTLDRFPNNDGNYEPGNCRWATPKQQTMNRRPYRSFPSRAANGRFTNV